jgi:hypothetical protein
MPTSPGNYEFRFYPNDQDTPLLAESAQITVDSVNSDRCAAGTASTTCRLFSGWWYFFVSNSPWQHHGQPNSMHRIQSLGWLLLSNHHHKKQHYGQSQERVLG